MWVLVMALVGYGCNENKLRLWKVYLYQGLLPAIHQFSDPEQYGISDCGPCYLCLYFDEEERV